MKSINLRVRGLGVSATLGINERSDALIRAGKKIYKLGLGQSPFPVPSSVVEALQRHAHQKDYLNVKGLLALREAVAAYHGRVQNLECGAEDVLIGPGSKELMFILQLVFYGDLVIPTPSWVSYAPQARILGRNVHWVATEAKNHWRLTAEELDGLCRKDPDCPRLVILNSPSNPTGSCHEDNELRALAEVARRYGLVMLSDEIYGEIHHRGAHRSIAPYYPEGTIVSGGLSKWCGAGGWRLGTFAFPRNLRPLLQAMSAVASETYTSTSAPIQHAAIRAFQGGPDLDAYLADSRRVLRILGETIYRKLAAAGVLLAPPQGGFYLFPDFTPFITKLKSRDIATGLQFCERLLAETGVALLPGSAFGRPESELTARIAYVNFDGERALAGAANLSGQNLDETFASDYCGEALEAIDHLCNWLVN